MQRIRQFFLFIILLQTASFSGFAQGSKQSVQHWNTKQPSRFTENKGQITDQNGKLRNDVKYIYSAPGFKAIFKDNSFSYEVYIVEKKPKKEQISEATGKPINDNHLPDKFKEPEDITIKTSRIDIELPGANKNPQIIAEGRSADYNNYYLAHTPEVGIQKVYNYTKLMYKNIWPNIDIVFYAKKDVELKYDIIVRPGGELKNISFAYNGAENISFRDCKLNLKTPYGAIQENIPISYLKESNEIVDVYYLQNANRIKFSGKYNNRKTLIIDPLLIWSTYYGGPDVDEAQCLSLDDSSNLFITGQTRSSSYIATAGAYQTSLGSNYNTIDAFLLKFTAKGKRVWSTYYGGTGEEYQMKLDIDNENNIYIGGRTTSEISIATTNAFQSKNGGNIDGFLAKFTNSGSRIWSTFYGGSNYDGVYSIKTDTLNNVFIVGNTQSKNNISSMYAFQAYIDGPSDGFIVKFNSSGSRIWSTYFGGEDDDECSSLAIDTFGYIYVCGWTESSNAISTNGAFQTKYPVPSTYSRFGCAYLAKFDSIGNRIWSTYYAGKYGSYATTVLVDKANNIYIGGGTGSVDSIASANAYQKYRYGISDAFLVKFDDTGKRIWGTYYGGEGSESAASLKFDRYGNINLIGTTNSKMFISTPKVYQDTFAGGDRDAYIVQFDSSGHRKAGTYFGGGGTDFGLGIACDTSGFVYICGSTDSLNILSNSHQSTIQGKTESYIAKLNFLKPDVGVLTIDSLDKTYCGSMNKIIYIRIKNYSTNINIDSINIGWSLNSKLKNEKKFGVFLNADDTTKIISLDTSKFDIGANIIKVWTYNPDELSDTILKNDTLIQIVTVLSQPSAKFSFAYNCLNDSIVFKNESYGDSLISHNWKFGDGNQSDLINPIYKYDSLGQYKIILKVTNSFGCSDTFSQNIAIIPKPIAKFTTQNICLSDTAYFTDSSTMAAEYVWSFGDSSISHLQNPIHKYFSAGTYMVKLVVKNSFGCSDTFTKSIVVSDMPKAIFSVHDICYTENLELADSSKGATDWLWKFGDDATSTDQNPKYKYASGGKYNIWLIVSNKAGCKDSVLHTITVDSICVWPGDANADKIVDNKDILAIGVAYSDTGSTRTDTSTIWKANQVQNWGNNFSSGANYKHADCDGDGIVSNADTFAVTRNYTKTHLKKFTTKRGKSTDPLLKIEIQNDSLKVGDTLVAYILLGENALPAKDIYGVAFSLNYNQDYFFAPKVDFTGNWLGNNTIGYSNSTNKLDIALTKTDHKNSSGAGKLAEIKLVVKADLNTAENLKIEIVNNTVISANENEIPVNIEDDSVQIYKTPNGIFSKSNTNLPEVKVFPNPFNNYTIIDYKLNKASQVQINIFDLSGRSRVLMQSSLQNAGEHQFMVDSEKYNISSGIYLLKIDIDGTPVYKKIVKLK